MIIIPVFVRHEHSGPPVVPPDWVIWAVVAFFVMWSAFCIRVILQTAGVL